MTLHLLGLVAPDARLPEVGSVRLIAGEDAALIVQEVPPDFGAEAAAALTEALLTEGWGAMCRLAETRTVVALRFGQTVDDDETARSVCAGLVEDGLLDRMSGLEEWTITFFPKPDAPATGRSYLAAKAGARQRQENLAQTVQTLADKIDSLKGMSEPVPAKDGVSVQMLFATKARAGTLEGLEAVAEEEGLDARALGPQPILHFADGGTRGD